MTINTDTQTQDTFTLATPSVSLQDVEKMATLPELEQARATVNSQFDAALKAHHEDSDNVPTPSLRFDEISDAITDAINKINTPGVNPEDAISLLQQDVNTAKVKALADIWESKISVPDASGSIVESTVKATHDEILTYNAKSPIMKASTAVLCDYWSNQDASGLERWKYMTSGDDTYTDVMSSLYSLSSGYVSMLRSIGSVKEAVIDIALGKSVEIVARAVKSVVSGSTYDDAIVESATYYSKSARDARRQEAAAKVKAQHDKEIEDAKNQARDSMNTFDILLRLEDGILALSSSDRNMVMRKLLRLVDQIKASEVKSEVK